MTAVVDIKGRTREAQRAMRDLAAAVDELGGELRETAQEATRAERVMDGLGSALPNRKLANFANAAMGVASSLSVIRGAFQTLRDSAEGYFRAQEDGQAQWDALMAQSREVYGAIFELIIGTDDASVAFDRMVQAIEVTNRAVEGAIRAVEPFASLIRGPLLAALEAFSEGSEQSRRELAAMQAQLTNAEAAARGYEDALRSLGGDTIQQAQGALDALTGAGSDYEHGLHVQIGTIRDLVRVMDEQGTASLLVRQRTLDGLGASSDAFDEFQRNARQALDPFVTRLAETGESIDSLRGETLRFSQAVTGADGLTRQVEFAVPVLDLLNRTMVNGQPASEQLALNLSFLSSAYTEQAQNAERSAGANATAEDAFIRVSDAVSQEYSPAIRAALDLLAELQPARDKAVASLVAEKDAATSAALALTELDEVRKADSQRKLADQLAEEAEAMRARDLAAAEMERTNQRLATSYYDLGAAVGQGTGSITEAVTKAAADQLRALIIRYTAEIALLGSVGRAFAAAALGVAVGKAQQALSKLGGGGSGAASGAVGLGGGGGQTVQNINVSVAQTNGMGAGIDTTRAIADAVNQGVRRGLIEVSR